MNKIRKEDYPILAVFCADYHSGQWSRGYRLFCKLHFRFYFIDQEKGLRKTEVYQHLVENYSNSI